MSASRHGGLVGLLAALTACGGHSAPGARVTTPEPSAVAAELLAADRAFAAAARRADPAAGLAPMLASDVVMRVPGGFAKGRDSALAAIRASPVTAGGGAHFDWTPIRVGVAADGQQGFTLGYITVHAGDGSTTPGKYLTYWVKGPDGWRAAVYGRGRASGAGNADPVPPLVPAHAVAPSADPDLIARYRQSLDTSERAFSRDAQEIGLRQAFVRYGSPDAMNMGGGGRPAFVVGPDSIGAVVSEGEPATGSSVSWAPDQGVLVASSGDLGVTIGTIVVNQPDSAGHRQTFPFFTVWHRAGPEEPWRYVAE
ncbi:MAG TPA: nuclear transport factor 2 family protein [Gemmatimonadales bacterium]|nr:nuclear transport factor 2 family protein [Gemmatimonadales bacterium]